MGLIIKGRPCWHTKTISPNYGDTVLNEVTLICVAVTLPRFIPIYADAMPQTRRPEPEERLTETPALPNVVGQHAAGS